MDKKGAIGLAMSQVLWIPRLIFLAVAIIFCLLLIGMLISISYAPEVAEREIFIQRVLFSPNGISYFNPVTSRMEPGTIDLRKFDSDLLNESVSYGGNYLAAKLLLKDLEKNQEYKIHYDKLAYDRWSVLRNLKGRGGVDFLEREFYVLIKDGEEIHKGKLEFEVYMPR